MIIEEDIVNVEFLHKDIYKSKYDFYIIKYEDGKKIIKKIEEKFYHYFYVLDNENVYNNFKILKVEKGYKSIFGEDVKKIICESLNRNSFKILRDSFSKTFEDDILFRNRFIIDNNIAFTKSQRICYIDIETNLGTDIFKVDKEIISIAFYDNFDKKYYSFVWRSDLEKQENKVGNTTIYYFSNEKDMLIEFYKIIKLISPDIYSGWFVNGFDLPYLIKRSELLKLNKYIENLSPFLNIKISNDLKTNLVYTILNDNKGNNKNKDEIYTKIYGCEILDLLKIYKKLTYDNKPDNYKLSTVAKHILNDDKDKVDNIEIMWKENIDNLVKYNLKDVKLCVDIDKKSKLIEYMLAVQHIIAIPLESVFFNSRVVDTLLLKKYHNEIVFPSKRKHTKEFALGAFAGYLVFKNNEIINENEPYIKEDNGVWIAEAPKASLLKNIAVFDFKSLYSNIYRTFNLSPELIDINGNLKIGEITINNNKIGVVPKMFEDLINERSKIEKERDEIMDRESVEYYAIQNLQGGIKTIANSITGVANYPSFRLYSPPISRTVMYIARLLLVEVKKYLDSIEYVTVSSDTDSFFVQLKNEDILEESHNIQEKLNKFLNEYIKNKFSLEKNYLNVDCEKIFKNIIFLGVKKQYIGKLLFEKGKKVDKLFVRGYEIVRRDTPNVFKKILKEVVLKLLENEEMINIKKYLEIEKKQLKEIDNWHIGITKQINKDLSEYKVLSQHIRAVKYSNHILNTNFTKSDVVKMLFIKNGEEDVIIIDEDVKLPDKIKVDYDRFFDFFIFNKLKDFENIEDFKNINILYNKNKNLMEFI